MILRCALALSLLSLPSLLPVAAQAPAPPPVVFEGGDSLSQKLRSRTVAAVLEEYEEEDRLKAYIDDAAFELRTLYHNRGFPFAEVEYRHEPERVVFLITEGPRARLEEVTFQGNESYPAGQLKAFFEPPRRGFFSLLRDPYYVESRIVDGAAAVESFYRATGFLEAEVPPPRVRFSDDRHQVWVTVAIAEGERRYLRGVEFAGIETMPESELQATVAEFIDHPFNPRTTYEMLGRLRDLYGRRGYPEADFEVTQQEEDGSVRLTVTVDSGPKVTVTGVEIAEAESSLKTRKGFLKSRMKVKPGKVYDSSAVQESMRRLYATGLFDRVRLELAPGEGAERPLRLEVEEAPNAEYFIEPGYGSFEEARLVAGLKRKNLFGAGVTLDADGVLAQRAAALTVSLTSPQLFAQELRLGLSADFEQREFPSFTRREIATDFSLQRDLTEHLGLLLGYQLSRSRQLDVQAVEADALPQREVDIAALRFGARFDNRDNVLAPRRGWQAEALLEYADQPLGTELEFFRAQTRLAWFYPLSERAVVALSWRSAVIVPLGDDPIPIQERFFNGGENTVRSFREDRLGPVDGAGNPRGGEVRNILSAELRYRLWGNLHGALFYDAGNVRAEYEKALDFSDLRSGIGVGVRYMLPIGPLRIDGAWNPDARPVTSDQTEDTFVVHLSVGMAF